MRSLQTGRTAGRLQTGPILAAYFGNVRSVIEYGCVIWGGAAPTHLKRLDRIQHKFLSWLSLYVQRHRPSNSLSRIMIYYNSSMSAVLKNGVSCTMCHSSTISCVEGWTPPICSAASRSMYHSVEPGPDQRNCSMYPPHMRQTRTPSGEGCLDGQYWRSTSMWTGSKLLTRSV